MLRGNMRTKPYTDIGIRRLKCVRCGKRAETQWQICADGNQYRPLCWDCDVALNRMVMIWMKFANWAEKIVSYQEKRKDTTGV